MSRNVRQDAPLDELLARAEARFGKVVFEPLSLGGTTIELLQVADMPAYLERLTRSLPPGKTVDLPLWAKVWPTALLMASFFQRMPPREGVEVLEIGAGVGAAGLFAAKAGYRVLLTDIEPDALLFARINALRNGLADRVETARADFTKDRLGRRFRLIVGCEVLYKESHFAPLADFLHEHLEAGPGSEVMLAQDAVRRPLAFFEAASSRFRIARRDFPLKAEGQSLLSAVYRMEALPHD